MPSLTTIPDERLHDLIYRVSCRRRAGELGLDNLLGAMLDEADRRGLGEDADEDDESDQEALLGYFLGALPISDAPRGS